MTLPQETVRRIEEEAEKCALEYVPSEEQWNDEFEMYFNRYKSIYIAGATSEAQRAMIVEAEKDKMKERMLAAEIILKKYYKRIPDCAELVRWSELFDNGQEDEPSRYQQLTAERDAYKSKSKLLWKHWRR